MGQTNKICVRFWNFSKMYLYMVKGNGVNSDSKIYSNGSMEMNNLPGLRSHVEDR